ncbi:Kinesin-like protein [Phytophthora cactorum]|nr:Kinesin-like protein [Phytophthora cactorum]
MHYSCYISYLEIYNENVYDLLDRSHTDRPIEEWTKVLLMDDDEGDMHFRNLGVFEAVSEEEALNLLFLGNMNRVTSDTPMNQASSRSHSIFSVMIESRPTDSNMIVTSKLHLVDLAGSERVYKRDGTQRMRSEGKHINLSLHHLEQVLIRLKSVILSLRTKKNAVSRTYHIPYRNSMLTSVLRGSLGVGLRRTLNPESDFQDESISTCRFMQRCSEVAVDIAVNTEVDTEKRLETVEKLNAELETTNLELQQRAVQLENDIKDQALHFAKQEQQWGQRLTLAQEETQAALAASKSARDRYDQKIDWMQCEEIVERLLLTGDLSREELDKPSSEGEFDEARLLYEAVAEEIKELGMATALRCLVVLKENTFFASNTAAELQELMTKQTRTVELLEQRLLEQKREAELLKDQIQRVTESQKSEELKVSIPRSKSHSGALRKRHPSGRRSVGDRDSVSDSENDTEASETHEYDRPSVARLQSSPTKPETIGREHKVSKRSEYSNPSISEETPIDDKQTTVRGPALTTDGVESSVPQMSGSDLIRKRMELLRNGSLFVKYGRYGKPHVRFVWCSTDLEYLHYRQVNSTVPKATIPTRSIVGICIGQETRVFERAKQPERAPHCFSVEYEENRTLDLEVADGESPEVKKTKRSDWVEALQFLIKLKATLKTA